MSLYEILHLDVTVEDGKERLLTALTKTSWLSKFDRDDITVEVLEKLYSKVRNKYNGQISSIHHVSYLSMQCTLVNNENSAWIATLYFTTCWECLAKVILALYGYYMKGIRFNKSEEKA